MSDPEEPHISSTLRWEDVRLPDSVSVSDLDALIFSVMKEKWQKTVMVIVKASQQPSAPAMPLGDQVIGARIVALARARRLASQGNLLMWRHSEVRLLDSLTDQERLSFYEAQAEQAYDEMYDATTPGDAAARYSDAKETLYDAIGLARSLGHTDVVERLEARLAHIKTVFRSQFS
jgi:hypothetical protein